MARCSDRVDAPGRVGVSGDGDRAASRFRLSPPGRRVQVPQLVVAILVVAVSALAGVVVFSQASAREPVLALANPVERGQMLTADDLRVVYVASEDPVATVSADALVSLVGRLAVADLEEGTIVTAVFFVDREVVAAGEGWWGWPCRRVSIRRCGWPREMWST